ncbi:MULTISPECIES: YjeJ family protein [Tenebrionibacter/Tenebrionicola group]|jgi:hypothetical protein|uniref:Uncharacterized protein n=2 Tax=Tenebrionibacter/Tenebrionicola group TaxID=2969848 RepID=A0A8K0V3L2_9ENTR|nr:MULTISPECIES: YjeJ family protein [Tenebrionibacter/Tenebrionicola group]MBK4716859.1 hypothetical protein [Tenebrionibacter intestinalis]MBV5097445.1 hypothetical protein [Tenebrionicola larvae]
MNQLTGLNTGIIKSPQGVVAIALKIAAQSRSQQRLYLPPDQLQSVLFATFNVYLILRQLHQQSPESVQAGVLASSKALSENIPAIDPDEVNKPDIDYRVTDFVMKRKPDNVHFLFFLKNGEVIALQLACVQVEYLLNVLLSTIRNADDAQLTALCLSANDFLPFYTVDFSGGEGRGINYNPFSPPAWKTALFNTFHSIIYRQPDGRLPCGAIIKSASTFNPGRIEAIAQFLLLNNALLTPYKHRKMTIDHAQLTIPAGEESLDRLLRSHLAHRNTKLTLSE